LTAGIVRVCCFSFFFLYDDDDVDLKEIKNIELDFFKMMKLFLLEISRRGSGSEGYGRPNNGNQGKRKREEGKSFLAICQFFFYLSNNCEPHFIGQGPDRFWQVAVVVGWRGIHTAFEAIFLVSFFFFWPRTLSREKELFEV
jgi:hypothetical protein